MKIARHALLSILLATPIAAQQLVITPETSTNPATLHQWLHSGDPRLVAWAADFARRNHDATTLAEIPSLLEHWPAPAVEGDFQSRQAQRHAIDAMLDALIQEDAQATLPAIRAIQESYPAQAVILIARLRPQDAQNTLTEWTYGATGTHSGRALARVASMLLAQNPTPDFVGNLVSAAEENLQVTLTADSSLRNGFGTGSSCGDSIGLGLTPGWPEVYDYYLVEDDTSPGASLLLDLDGDRIQFRRREESKGWGFCNSIEGLTPVTRHRLIAHLLGVSPRDMPWQPVEHATLEWTNLAAYQQQLGQAVESHRATLQATVDALRAKDLLRGDWTTMIAPVTAPRLVVTVQCSITPCPLNLAKK